MLEKIVQWDINLFLFLNNLHSEFWDGIMWYISYKYTWIPLYAIILFFIIYKYRVKAVLPIIFIVLLIVASDQSSVHLFKETIQRLRPCHNPDLKNMVHIVNNKCGGQYGFVSSHATNSFAFAIFTSFLFNNKPYSWFIMIWAAIVSYSRVYLGVHFPGDIMGGAVLGMGLGIAFFAIYTKTYQKFHGDKKERLTS